MSTKRGGARLRGFTLIELIIFIMIVGVAVAGVIRVITLTSANSVDPQIRKQALSIAAGLLEEIELSGFTYCDPSDATFDTATVAALGVGGCATLPEVFGQEAGDSRMFDNVNDYGTAAGVATPYTQDAAGNNFPAGYTVNVSINYEPALGPAGAPLVSTAANTNVLRINVKVVYTPSGEVVELDGFRTRYAPNLP